jgi:hypothetical protein
MRWSYCTGWTGWTPSRGFCRLAENSLTRDIRDGVAADRANVIDFDDGSGLLLYFCCKKGLSLSKQAFFVRLEGLEPPAFWSAI